MSGVYSRELVEKYYPGAIMIKPMKYGALPKNKKGITIETICNNGEYFAQIKEDGNLYMFVKGMGGECYLFSRNQSVQTKLLTEKIGNVPHIQEAFEDLPNGTILLGEIFYPGGDSNMARTIMGCLPSTAIARQLEKGLIHYHIFDMIAYDGTMLFNTQALDRALKTKEVFDTLDLGKHSFLHFAEIHTENLYQLGLDVLAEGGEGIVLKKKTGLYVPDKRPAWNSVKFKKEDSADLVCMGHLPPTKEYDGTELDSWEFFEDGVAVTKPYYYGWAGSMVIGAYNNEGKLVEVGTVSSGLTDLVRAELTSNPDKYLNKVVKIDMMEKFEETIRQPIYRGLHADKNPEECLLSEIFNK